VACNEPLNGENNCLSCAEMSSFQIPIDNKGLNELTGEEDGAFSISELEVWEMIWY